MKRWARVIWSRRPRSRGRSRARSARRRGPCRLRDPEPRLAGRAGRDLEAYLAVYADFWHTDAVFPWEMLTGRRLRRWSSAASSTSAARSCLEVFGALLFAGTILLYARTALLFGRGAGACSSSVALVLFPGYGIVFHELGERDRLRRGLRGWTAIVVRAALFPSAWRFAAAGAVTALIALTRPANQVFLLVGDPAALLAGTVARPARADARLRAASPSSCSAHGRRRTSGATTTSPSRGAARPACRSSARSSPTTSSIPTTGRPRESSPRRCSATSSRSQPYRAYGIDLRDVLLARQPARARGPDQPLRPGLGLGLGLPDPGPRGAGGGAEHPGTFARGVLRRLRQGARQAALRRTEAAADGLRRQRGGRHRPGCRRSSSTGGRCPTPTEGEPIPSEYQSAQISTPDHSIREVWTSPTEHHIVFDDPAKRRALDRQRPPCRGALRRVPRPLVEPVARPADGPLLEALPAALAVAPRRRRRRRAGGGRGSWWATLAPVLGALAMLLATVMTVWAEPAYAVPVAPAFVLFAAVGLLGDRRARAVGAASTTSSATSSAFRPSR